jgi:hypothetical protein
MAENCEGIKGGLVILEDLGLTQTPFQSGMQLPDERAESLRATSYRVFSVK